MNHMNEIANGIATQLRSIARAMELGEQAEGPGDCFEYTFRIGKGWYKIRCEYTPLGLRERADALEKNARRFGDGQTSNARECARAARWKPSYSQPTAASRVAIIKRMKNDDDDGLAGWGWRIENVKQLEALSPG